MKLSPTQLKRFYDKLLQEEMCKEVKPYWQPKSMRDKYDEDENFDLVDIETPIDKAERDWEEEQALLDQESEDYLQKDDEYIDSPEISSYLDRENIEKLVGPDETEREFKIRQNLVDLFSKDDDMKITGKELKEMIRGAIKQKLQEQTGLIDTQQQVLDAQRQRLEIEELALETFAKLEQKLGIDEDALQPEAKEIVNDALAQLKETMLSLGGSLAQIATVSSVAKEEV